MKSVLEENITLMGKKGHLKVLQESTPSYFILYVKLKVLLFK